MSLPVWFELSVMTLNCVFGAAVARSRNVPIYGTLLAGLLVGLGGGAVRDMMLNLEPVIISEWFYIPAGILGAIVGGLLFGKVLSKPARFALIQGLTLGFLMTIGSQKALQYDTPLVSAMVLGVVTASFGGMIADVLSGYRATVMRQAHWVASALTVGSVVFVLMSVYVGFWPAVVTGVLVVTALRYVSQVRNWPSPRWPGESLATPDNPPAPTQ